MDCPIKWTSLLGGACRAKTSSNQHSFLVETSGPTRSLYEDSKNAFSVWISIIETREKHEQIIRRSGIVKTSLKAWKQHHSIVVHTTETDSYERRTSEGCMRCRCVLGLSLHRKYTQSHAESVRVTKCLLLFVCVLPCLSICVYMVSQLTQWHTPIRGSGQGPGLAWPN